MKHLRDLYNKALEDYEKELTKRQELEKQNKQFKIQIRDREEKYRKLEDKYKELDKMCELYSKSLYNAELNQYKDNWNKLKEYLKDFDIEYLNEIMEHNLANTLENILSKMQELEQGSGINDSN